MSPWTADMQRRWVALHEKDDGTTDLPICTADEFFGPRTARKPISKPQRREEPKKMSEPEPELRPIREIAQEVCDEKITFAEGVALGYHPASLRGLVGSIKRQRRASEQPPVPVQTDAVDKSTLEATKALVETQLQSPLSTLEPSSLLLSSDADGAVRWVPTEAGLKALDAERTVSRRDLSSLVLSRDLELYFSLPQEAQDAIRHLITMP